MRIKARLAAAIAGILLTAVVADAKERSFTCWFKYTWWNTRLDLGSGVNVGDEFVVPLREGVTSRTVKGWPQVVLGAVEVVYDWGFEPHRPWLLRLVVMPSESEEKEWFRSPKAAEAEVPVRDKWSVVSVRRHVLDGELVHTYTLSCRPR